MRLYLFNPEHDLALACNEPHYMAPESARQMASDLSLLPFWYADAGGRVLVDGEAQVEYARRMAGLFGNGVEVAAGNAAFPGVSEIVPWGWNPALCRRMHSAGVPAGLLPSPGWLACYRALSGRLTAVEVLEALPRRRGLAGDCRWLTSLGECVGFCRHREGGVLFKAPWSGSGKGLLWCRSQFGAPLQAWCAKVIREQGGVVASPIYNKVCDFAMEFAADGQGGVCFEGYSLFRTNAKGAYLGNLLLSDADIECRLGQYVPVGLLHAVRTDLIGQLRCRFGAYRGALGVDMMVVGVAGGYSLFPCVEINVRMNMGLVSHRFYHRYVSPASRGEFRVERFATSEELVRQHVADGAEAPLCIRGGRIVSGYLPLAPATEGCTYRAFVRVAEK